MNKGGDMYPLLGNQEAFPVHGLACYSQDQGLPKSTITEV